MISSVYVASNYFKLSNATEKKWLKIIRFIVFDRLLMK